jgi:low temperature requirement protein LtrA
MKHDKQSVGLFRLYFESNQNYIFNTILLKTKTDLLQYLISYVSFYCSFGLIN